MASVILRKMTGETDSPFKLKIPHMPHIIRSPLAIAPAWRRRWRECLVQNGRIL